MLDNSAIGGIDAEITVFPDIFAQVLRAGDDRATLERMEGLGRVETQATYVPII